MIICKSLTTCMPTTEFFRLKTELWDLVTSTITTSTPILPSGDYNYGGIFHFDANQCRASGKLSTLNSQERFFLTYYHSEKFCIEVTSHGEPMPSISGAHEFTIFYEQ